MPQNPASNARTQIAAAQLLCMQMTRIGSGAERTMQFLITDMRHAFLNFAAPHHVLRVARSKMYFILSCQLCSMRERRSSSTFDHSECAE
jgi:hypothetical protein